MVVLPARSLSLRVTRWMSKGRAEVATAAEAEAAPVASHPGVWHPWLRLSALAQLREPISAAQSPANEGLSVASRYKETLLRHPAARV
jgi:hypothetical protein